MSFEYEGAVMSGTPVLRMARQTLARPGGVRGHPQQHLQLCADAYGREDSVLPMQWPRRKHGYPRRRTRAADVEYDVRLKVVILANELLGACL